MLLWYLLSSLPFLLTPPAALLRLTLSRFLLGPRALFHLAATTLLRAVTTILTATVAKYRLEEKKKKPKYVPSPLPFACVPPPRGASPPPRAVASLPLSSCASPRARAGSAPPLPVSIFPAPRASSFSLPRVASVPLPLWDISAKCGEAEAGVIAFVPCASSSLRLRSRSSRSFLRISISRSAGSCSGMNKYR